jgi:small-conductance mechanosensitive channel
VTVFPNSLLLSNPLVKENPGQEYGLYTVVIPLTSEDDWQNAERRLLEAAKAECASFMEIASRQMKLLEETNLLEAPSPEPRVTIQLPDAGRVHLVLRFPALDRGRSRVEQAILRRFLAR